MKTTFKKTIDKFDTSYVNDESKIIEDLDISIDNITENVMQNISSDKKPRKKHKNITFMLIAAALTTAIVGTTAAAVALNKKDDFSEVISGESKVLPIYYNDNLKIESIDDNLEVNLLGVKGNSKLIYAALEISTKDGSSIIGDEDCDGFFSPTMLIGRTVEPQIFEYAFDTMIGVHFDNGYEYSIGESYYITNEDSNSIKMYIKIDGEDLQEELYNSSIMVKSDYIDLFKYGEEIYSFDKIDNKAKETIYSTNWDEICDFGYPMWDKRDGKYKIRKMDKIIRKELPFKVYINIGDTIVENKKINFKLTHENAPHTINEGDSLDITFSDNRISVNIKPNLIDDSPFCEYSVNWPVSKEDNNAKIILKNGNEYWFEMPEDIPSEKNEIFSKEFPDYIEYYIYYRSNMIDNDEYYNVKKITDDIIDPEIEKITFIDPTNIDKIIINGDTVYKAE